MRESEAPNVGREQNVNNVKYADMLLIRHQSFFLYCLSESQRLPGLLLQI